MKTMKEVEYQAVRVVIEGGRAVQGVKLPWEKKFKLLGGKNEESLKIWVEKYVKEAFERKEARNAEMTKRREADKASRLQAVQVLKIGDIFEASWGYEQTNVDFYQVVGIIGKMAELRPINGQQVPDGGGYSSMSAHVVAVKDSFIKENTFKKLIQGYNGKPCFTFCSYKSAYLWDGTPKYISWYA